MSDDSRRLQNPPHQLDLPRSLADPEDGSTNSLVDTDPPDGGKVAWLVVLGSALALFSTTGVNTAFGFFQAYYTETLLSNSSSSTISLIGALQIALVYGGGPITGKLFDAYGLRILLPLGSFLVVLSLMLVSVCQQNRPYQFFLVQGILSGIGNAMIYTPAVAVMGHWFKRRRGYAMGIISAGSSLGGVIYPIMLQHLQERVGFAWAVRIAGFVTLACVTVAVLTMKTRLPMKGTVTISQLVDLQGFRDIRYTLSAVSSFLFFYALFTPYFYIEEYADFQGVSPRLSPYLISIINGCAIPARIIPGIFADRLGVLEILLPSIVFSGGIVLALWLPSRGTVPIILFSAFYGLFSSSFVSLFPAYVATITPVEKFGARLGTVFFFAAIACLVGTPTAGAFVPTFTQDNFNHLIIFTGVLLLMSAALLAVAHRISPQGQNGDGSLETKTRPTPASVPQDPETREDDGLHDAKASENSSGLSSTKQ